MMNGLRLAVSLSVLLLAPAAFAGPGADAGTGASTVVVITPPAPVMVGAPAERLPPGAAEVPPAPMPAAAAPAPQNEDWNNVSHINGTPVPVGERGNYLYKWKTTNIATNPIGWMAGFYGLSISHAIHHNVAIRGDANVLRPFDSNTSGYEFGATLPVYFKRVYQGPFIEPGLIVRTFDSSSSSDTFTGAQVNFGWHWTFDSGLNFAAAFGLARRLNQQTMDEYGDTGDKIEPVGYFRVGYAY
jgi:hypothetical protein